MTPCNNGYYSALDGVTTNPYGTPGRRAEWIRGYAIADELGLALLPRFGTTKGRKR